MATSIKKILVVDDEDDIRVYLSRLFQEEGFLVACASNVEAALLAVERERPDLITLDVSMPEASGGKFYRSIKSQPELSNIPVVFVTGVTGPGGSRDTEHFYGTRSHLPPPDGFVAKPIDPEEMVALVRKLTGSAAIGATAN
jgi:CheY-like chemotaxis protein